MHINDLGYDVLHRLFSTLREEYDLSDGCNYKELVEVSAVCRSWRVLLLPYLYETVHIAESYFTFKSNVSLILGSGRTKYAKTVEVRIENLFVDKCGVACVLGESGIDKSSWPQVKKLKIINKLEEHTVCGYKEILDINFGHSDCDQKRVVDLLRKCMPNIEEVVYLGDAWKGVPLLTGNRVEYTAILFNELIKHYGKKLRKVRLDFGDYMLQAFPFTWQMTHLDISMDGGYERHILPKIFATPLQSLVIRNASSDITWNWFNSDGSDDGDSDVWFSNLKELTIYFEYKPRGPFQMYHNGVLPSGDMADFKSDYCNGSKRVHFPALERLKIDHYPYKDSTFYGLFENTPLLKVVEVDSPRMAGFHIPSLLLTNSSDMKLFIRLDNEQFRGNGIEEQDAELMELDAYEKSVAKLISSPSAAHFVHLNAMNLRCISLPDTLAWNSVRRLELQFYVRMRSIYTVLAQLPLLKHLRFILREEEMLSVSSGGGNPKQQPCKPNESVSSIAVSFHGRFNEGEVRSAFMTCMAPLFPLVPSLLKLAVRDDVMDDVVEYVSDPNNSLEWLSEQLEVVEWR